MTEIHLAQLARRRARLFPIRWARLAVYKLLSSLFEAISVELRAQDQRTNEGLARLERRVEDLQRDIAELRQRIDQQMAQFDQFAQFEQFKRFDDFDRRLRTELEAARDRLAQVGPLELAAIEGSDLIALRNRLRDIEDRLRA